MARFLLSARPAIAVLPFLSRSYISEMRQSAFKDNLLRILRTEISYESDYRPPSPPASSFGDFSVEDRPGEQWVRLRRRVGREEVKIDATMFDGAAPLPASLPKKLDALEEAGGARLHISLVVEVSKGSSLPSSSSQPHHALHFICSAWPDSLDVQKVFPAPTGGAPGAMRPYMGPDFKELDDELQGAVREYLEERGVNEELAEFLHEYMANKDKAELLRWLHTVKACVEK